MDKSGKRSAVMGPPPPLSSSFPLKVRPFISSCRWSWSAASSQRSLERSRSRNRKRLIGLLCGFGKVNINVWNYGYLL